MKCLFSPEPSSWGFRGDPYLWKAIQEELEEKSFSSIEEFHKQLIKTFGDLTGHRLDDEDFYMKRFAHGGMSSGMISTEFWRKRGIPLLVERFEQNFILTSLISMP